MAGDRARILAAMTDEEFRTKFRQWLESDYPQDWKVDHLRPFRRLRGNDAAHWVRMLTESGWRCPAWPVEHGGLDLSFRRQVIYHQELERIRAARTIDLGEVQLGPTLMLFGTDEQKERYLSQIRGGEHIWCQGYSEPNAGSDLASLTTAATRDGDVFHVQGQKIWTTHAEEATHMFALVRTSRMERNQQGITFLMIEMNSPGVSIRPIRNIAGEDEFCEVFLDDVEVPVGNVLGAIDHGWAVAKALLGFERVWIGSPTLARQALLLSRDLLAARGGEPIAASRYAELAAELHDVSSLYRQTCAAIGDDAEPGPEVSMLKIASSELLQRITEFNVELAAEAAGQVGQSQIGNVLTDIGWQYFTARPTTIFAGSNEIQRNILAKSVLRLPVGSGR